MTSVQDILEEIPAVRAEKNTEKRLSMLQNLNESLPEEMKLQIPALITNAYVRKALDTIEERILISAA